MKEQKQYVIRQPKDGRERDRSLEYVRDHMFKWHGCHPPIDKTPPDLFIALDGDEIVGSLAVEFGSRDAPLPIEVLFAFDRGLLPIAYERERTIYYSRWNSSRPYLGLAIWLVASQYALDRGFVFSSATGKQKMLDRYRQSFGCEWFPIPGAQIRHENVGESEREYFYGKLGEPITPPTPWVGLIADQIAHLPAIVAGHASTWEAVAQM